MAGTAVGKDRILGAWSNGTSPNANFVIKVDSIYYEDNNESYKYTLTGDTIHIYFTDFTYMGKIFFKGDTLMMVNKEDGSSKYWRFKD